MEFVTWWELIETKVQRGILNFQYDAEEDAEWSEIESSDRREKKEKLWNTIFKFGIFDFKIEFVFFFWFRVSAAVSWFLMYKLLAAGEFI